MAKLSAQQIVKLYHAVEGPSLQILDGASLELDAGENLAIVGPSGSGKSTLLAILGTLDRPTSGTVKLDGIDPFGLTERQLAQFRSEQIGFIFQDHHLLPQCTVIENVIVPFLADGNAGPEQIEVARQLLERVGLADRQLHRPSQLSGGEKQRVAIARALVREPTLLLADEPTGNLDQATATTVLRLLVELQQERNSIMVVVTHSEAIATDLQRRGVLSAGRLQF
ncbi:MAG: ABC transporter ATP-binding protein [Planctomycetota bacterium]